MIPTVYIFVRGGVVEAARTTGAANVEVIDFDEAEANGRTGDEEAVEVAGKTLAEIEAITEEIY
jgi:hypothetical protein